MSGTRIDIAQARDHAAKIGNAAQEMESLAQQLKRCVESIGEHWQGQAHKKFEGIAADLGGQLNKTIINVREVHSGVNKTLTGYEAHDNQ